MCDISASVMITWTRGGAEIPIGKLGSRHFPAIGGCAHAPAQAWGRRLLQAALCRGGSRRAGGEGSAGDAFPQTCCFGRQGISLGLSAEFTQFL